MRSVALFVAFTIVAAACSSGTQTSSFDVEERTVDFDVLVFRQGPDGVSGQTRPVSVTIEPSGDEGFKLGSIESDVRGSGEQWKASEWAGASVALLTTGVDPSDVEVTFEVEGQIDGPSAGAAMTVGVAAALNGHELRDGVVMTGTINPDGSIGPVGGIPQKIEGAADAGMTTVLIPAGLSQSVDLATGETIDVIERGERLGLRVREVDDIFVAYELFTGEKISHVPEPVEQYALSDEAVSVLNERTGKWLDIHDQAAADAATIAPEIYDLLGIDAYLDEGAQQVALANEYLDNGLPAAAIDTASFAALRVLQANDLAAGAVAYVSEGVEGLRSYVESLNVAAGIEDTMQVLEKVQPNSISEVAALAAAYSFVFDALGILLTGEQLLGLGPATPEQELDWMIDVLLRYSQASTVLDLALDMLDAGSEIESGEIEEGFDVEAISQFFDQAADANLTLFESVTVPEVAEAAGTTEKNARTLLAVRDATYGRALFVENSLKRLEDSADPDTDLTYARLGAAMSSYVLAAELIAKYYSLDAELDPATLTATDFANVDGLQAMFAASEEQVLRGAALFEENNVDATPVMVFYEMAVTETAEALEQDPIDATLLLTGLSSMWTAQLYTSLLGFFGGFAGGR